MTMIMIMVRRIIGEDGVSRSKFVGWVVTHPTNLLLPRHALHASMISLNLERIVEYGIRAQPIGFTVLSKNLSFTHRLSGYFLEVLWDQKGVL